MLRRLLVNAARNFGEGRIADIYLIRNPGTLVRVPTEPDAGLA
ncbi:hypothetical protein [Rhizobium etli]|uniref:Uncharacterized protein n=1 Tax=Rhizobium etli TaxID=29449 RepID=A0A7W6ZM81_RHIET|nr:hypothetical protein [Rhizobium etli]MBB4482636.1 hypothetical protein [Rhizobium etli]MBB4538588.1 hypothetical protein [Rhizobium etli]